MPRADTAFRYGIEHECALLRPDGSFADFTNTTFDELQDIVDELPDLPPGAQLPPGINAPKATAAKKERAR